MTVRAGAPVSPLSAALFGFACAVVALLVTFPFEFGGSNLHEDDIAPRDLVAQRDAQFVSEVLTQQAREDAAEAVEPVYTPRDPEVAVAQRAALAAVIDAVRLVRQRSDLPTQQEKLRALQEQPDVARLGTETLAGMLAMPPEVFEELAARAVSALDAILAQEVPPGRSLAAVDAYLSDPANLPSSAAAQSALRVLLTNFVVPNVQVDEAATEAKRRDAMENVPPRVVTFARGQVIVPEGARITAADIEALRETGVIEEGIDRSDLLASVLVAASFGVLLGTYGYTLGGELDATGRKLAVVAVAVAAVLAIVRIAAPSILPDEEGLYLMYALPVATAGMIAAAFVGLPFGAVVAALTGLLAAFVVVTEPSVPAATLRSSTDALRLAAAYVAAGLAACLPVRNVDRLVKFGQAAIMAALANFGVLAAFWLLYDTSSTRDVPWMALASVVGGSTSALAAVGLYVFLAQALRVTTRLQLLEVASTTTPLMRRLQEEAPGTYHHSLMVAALAERAAERIGADALLARAGAYYHDVGKLAAPQFFVENMLDGQPSPHDELDPAESARIIRSHVTEGIALAKQYGLPAPVRAFIPEHHGTRMVTYFYRNAVRRGDQVDSAQFRYPGPKPQSRESAIVMLADSCEAVVRASAERDPERISELVDSVVAERLAEGQLDECDITMRELQIVAESFKQTLRAVYHRRIEYPEPVPEELVTAFAEGGSGAAREEDSNDAARGAEG